MGKVFFLLILLFTFVHANAENKDDAAMINLSFDKDKSQLKIFIANKGAQKFSFYNSFNDRSPSFVWIKYTSLGGDVLGVGDLFPDGYMSGNVFVSSFVKKPVRLDFVSVGNVFSKKIFLNQITDGLDLSFLDVIKKTTGYCFAFKVRIYRDEMLADFIEQESERICVKAPMRQAP